MHLSMASSYGAASPAPTGPLLFNGASEKRSGVNFTMQSVGFLAVPPLLMYAFLNIIFATLAGTWLPVAIVCAALCVAFAGLFYSIGKNHVKGPAYTFLSALCFLATGSGIMSGLSVQARFFGPYWNYHHRPAYGDVLATDPAAARSDAGVINFANNAIVDTLRSGNVQSSSGRKFCAAPILDESQQVTAEFWAVGMECCEGHVGYYCDDVQDGSAKSGAVVFRMNSWLVRDPYYKYMDAVKQAAARNKMQLPPTPMLVRWVKDPATITDGLWGEGLTHVLGGIAAYAVISGFLGLVLHAACQQSH